MSQYPQREGEADCRDFLRTGRCKYGESCKYHHPANVQSGGGIKTPLDPNEPPFPLRPNEPNCQYYLKHGTCKFGQTCKFHHPPELIGVGSLGKHQANSQYQCTPVHTGNTFSTSGNEVIMMLPQRPNEPDCIYYLKNGRCKYGSTCKFHHPLLPYQSVNIGNLNENTSLNGNQQVFTGRTSHLRKRSYSTGSPNEKTLTSAPTQIPVSLFPGPSINSNQQHGINNSGPTHILVPEGQIAVMLNHSGKYLNNGGNQFLPQQTGQQNSNINLNIQSNVASSPLMSSSIASSYDTTSSFELHGPGISSSTNDSHRRWQRSPLQRPTNNGFANNYSSQSNTRANGPLRQQMSNQYILTPRQKATDMLYSNSDGNLATPLRHNQSSLINVQANADVYDRRTVSLGSSTELGMHSTADNGRHIGMSPLQRSWESNASLPSMQMRYSDENSRVTNIPANVNGYISNNADSLVEFDICRETADSNVSRGTKLNNYMHADNPIKNIDELRVKQIRSPNISRNLSTQNFQQQIQSQIKFKSNQTANNVNFGAAQYNTDEDGLSNMTSALLNMLDTSEDSVEKSPPQDGLSLLPNSRDTISLKQRSFSMEEFKQVVLPTQSGVNSRNIKSSNPSDGNIASNLNISTHMYQNESEKMSSTDIRSNPNSNSHTSWYAIADEKRHNQSQANSSNRMYIP